MAAEDHRAMPPRPVRERRVVLPFGPFEDPSTCAHAWEPHLWEVGKDYCPHCTSERPRTPDRPRKGRR